MQNNQKTAVNIARYRVYGIPASYVNKTWESTATPKSEITRLTTVFDGDLPSGSVLFVNGSAAPIVNQLLSKGKTVRGIDMSERLALPFDIYNNPKADVVLLYGLEFPTGNQKVIQRVFFDVINFYKASNSLIIISSTDTSAVFEGNYGIKLVNKLIIKEPIEKSFL
jgi:hypothetical protein